MPDDATTPAPANQQPNDVGLTPVSNVSGDTPGVFTMLGGNTNCPKCGSPPSEHEVRNHSLMWRDGDVYCTRCGAYVRLYDAG